MNQMKTFLGYTLAMLGMAGQAMAGNITPEIGASTAVGALALVSGGIMVLRSRRK